MPQPVFQKNAGQGRTVQFGGLALPNGQGTLANINLNDWTSWFLQDVQIETAQELGLGRLLYRGRSSYLSSDFPPVILRLSMEFREAVTTLGTVIPKLLMAGRQNLTFDTITAGPVRLQGVSNRQAVVLAPAVPRWSFDLEFACEQQWFQDLTPSTYINALALNSGSVTNTNVTYAGSIWAEPVFTLNIPNTNAAPIASFALANTMSGETLTIVFPGNLAASTTWAITIDSGTFTVSDASGVKYDVTGSFPMLYSPAGQVQQISATLTPASGTATGCNLTAVATNRWML